MVSQGGWTAQLTSYKDRGDFELEAQLNGEKGFYDCPVMLFFFGSSDPDERKRLEKMLKEDKLVKATELKNTRQDAEAMRKLTGLRNGGSTVGLGSEGSVELEPETISLESILKSSESIDLRKDGDAIKSLAISEKDLEDMPMAEQPDRLESTLLPYQLQVSRMN